VRLYVGVVRRWLAYGGAADRLDTGLLQSWLGDRRRQKAAPATINVDIKALRAFYDTMALSGVFTLLPLLTGEGKVHHGEILREATRFAEAGMIKPLLDARQFDLDTVDDAYALIEQRQAQGKVVVSINH
jgi:NADPH:quinone reductase-like Zn-dependent oxidoreductase